MPNALVYAAEIIVSVWAAVYAAVLITRKK